MKTLRRLLIVFIIFLLVASALPFAIPIHEGGIDPAQLVTDADGAFLTLQDIRVHYKDEGDQEAPAIVLIHGLFGSTLTWRYNVDALLEAGYRVITFDRPGFGLSDKTTTFNYAISNQADLTAALLNALAVESAVIVGHSAGGNVAASFALRHPDQVDRLVLVDAAVGFGGPPAFVGSLITLPPVWRWGRVGLQAYFTRENVEATLRSFQANPAFLTEADYDAYWRAFQTPSWDIALLAITRDLAVDALDDAAIRQITARTLLIWGAKDMLTPLAQGERLVKLLPGSQLVVIPDAGHQPFEEAPQAFNQALIAFLNE
jgi:pimeloyl-ACP methyl ester carboxylesterase